MSDAGDVGDDPRQVDPDRAGVAVVVAGASARGAYEAGVLSVLLPALEAQGLRPDIFVGSSAGAINAVAFAAMSNLSAEAAGTKATDLWRSIQQGDVFRPPLRSTLAAVGGWVARASRPRRPPRPAGVLDTSPLEATLARLIDWNQLHASISAHRVTAVAVTATACSTHRTTVFVEQGAGRRLPASDPGRAIDYLGADLDRRHIVASSAVPVVFPAAHIDTPAQARGWYMDGGVRLNTPIKPALALGAKRVIVIATAAALPPSPVAAAGAGAAIAAGGAGGGPASAGSEPGPPSFAGGAMELVHAILVDRMIEDIYTLSSKNAQAQEAAGKGDASRHEVIPWIFAGPSAAGDGELGQLVTETFRHATGPGRALRRRIAKVLGHDPNRPEIVSYLCFEPEFIAGAIRLGQTDAGRCLDSDGLPIWHIAPERDLLADPEAHQSGSPSTGGPG